MILCIKDTLKLLSMVIVSFCAVIVCAMFLNYDLDLRTIEGLLTTEAAKLFYDAQSSASKVVSALSGGCLFLTSVVLLCFYVGHYIDTHQKQLGILKALGYTRAGIAKSFWVFGLPVFVGAALGYLGAHFIMPTFYELQNKEGYLPDVPLSFHPGLCAVLVFAPAAFFSVLAMGYSFRKLHAPALWLMKEQSIQKVVTAKKETQLSFLRELEKSNIRQKKSLIFFITFAVFCFAAMTQMSCSMDEMASKMMGIMMMSIGIVLAAVTLLIAVTSVLKANRKTIIMMKVFGYSTKECQKAVLSGYRPWACFGFAIGTIYQYLLLKIVVSAVFKDIEGVPDYQFDVPVMLLTFAAFLFLYEAIMFQYKKKMEKMSVKEIMLD